MNYGYIRVSSDRQTVENQRFEVLQKAADLRILIDHWIEEVESGKESAKDRQLGGLIDGLQKGDTLLVSELSRVGRSVLEIMAILHSCMVNNVVVYACKEGYVLGNDIQSKVLAFAFGLSAEIEGKLISQRTITSLARLKAEGVTLGRPKGSRAKEVKLSGQDEQIRELLKNKVSVAAIARILGVNRQTVTTYIKTRIEQ